MLSLFFVGWWNKGRSGSVSGRDRLCQGRVVWCGTRRTAWQERWCRSGDQARRNRTMPLCVRLCRCLCLGLSQSLCVPHRYFQCMPRYGLFAPVHKVTRIGFPCTTPTKAKSSQRRSLLKRSPSASSMSSLSSANSSFSGKPSRAGLVSLVPHHSGHS